jgi:hypothetical protein
MSTSSLVLIKPQDTNTSHPLDQTSEDPLFSHIFQYDEDILEAMTTPNYPWDAMHHRSFFLSQESFQPCLDTHVCVIETKYFIPPDMWIGSRIQSPHLTLLKKGTWSNISPTIKIDISVKLNIFEEITLGAACSPKKSPLTSLSFRIFGMFFS